MAAILFVGERDPDRPDWSDTRDESECELETAEASAPLDPTSDGVWVQLSVDCLQTTGCGLRAEERRRRR